SRPSTTHGMLECCRGRPSSCKSYLPPGRILYFFDADIRLGISHLIDRLLFVSRTITDQAFNRTLRNRGRHFAEPQPALCDRAQRWASRKILSQADESLPSRRRISVHPMDSKAAVLLAGGVGISPTLRGYRHEVDVCAGCG